MSLMLPDGIAETPQPRLQKRVGRSSRVHRQTAGRDYAAPLQWKLLSLSSASGWTARKYMSGRDIRCIYFSND
jgi:hypothetical protein